MNYSENLNTLDATAAHAPVKPVLGNMKYFNLVKAYLKFGGLI